ncbi:MAG: hypothetical protein R3B70_44390 [Polyangiaceae bacterium]
MHALPCSRAAVLARVLARAAVLACAAGLACAAVGCVETAPLPPPEMAPVEPSGEPALYAFRTTEGGLFTSADMHGRFTVIAFVATHDLISQAQVKVLGLVQRDHVPRVNVAAVLLGPPENDPIAVAYGQSLHASFPIGISDLESVASSRAFSAVRSVPSVVILDRDGRVVMRHAGAMDEKPLNDELSRLGARR